MVNFIISGVVPGTHLQVTFLLWQMTILAIVGYAIVRITRSFKRVQSNNGDDEQTPQAA